MIEPRPKCTPKIYVLAEINPDGILVVTAKDGSNQESLHIQTSRNNSMNASQYMTIMPNEIYEEEFELLYNLYRGLRQQILFCLEENIYLKIEDTIKKTQLELLMNYDNIIDKYKLDFPRLYGEDINMLYNLNLMEKNIIDIKKILENINEEFKDYLINYELDTYENKINWKKKLETIVENIEKYNLSEEQETNIYILIENIISKNNENCESYFTKLDELLGFDL
jgi:molecular chaperone DnaK (HSP70)